MKRMAWISMVMALLLVLGGLGSAMGAATVNKAVTIGGQASMPIYDNNAEASDTAIGLAERDYVDKASFNNGVVAGTNNSAVEYGDHYGVHKTVITMASTVIPCTDEAGTILWCALKVYDFPAGNIMILGVTADTDVVTSGNLDATANGDFGMGTATCDNNADLTSTEQNLIPKTDIAETVADEGPITGINAAAIAPMNGTSSAVDVFYNAIWDDGDHNGGAMAVTGTVTIHWVNLGDI